MLALREGEERSMAEGGRGSVVKDGRDGGVLARLVELGTPFRSHSRGGFESEVDLWRQESGELVMHHHAAALLLGRRGSVW
jgi:hypothetical protein